MYEQFLVSDTIWNQGSLKFDIVTIFLPLVGDRETLIALNETYDLKLLHVKNQINSNPSLNDSLNHKNKNHMEQKGDVNPIVHCLAELGEKSHENLSMSSLQQNEINVVFVTFDLFLLF